MTWNSKVAEVLLRKGAAVNARTKSGETALMVATRNQYVQIGGLLRQAGAK